MASNLSITKVIEYTPPYFPLPPSGYGGSERVIANLIEAFGKNAANLPFDLEVWAAGDSYADVDESNRPALVTTAEKSFGLQKPFESNAQIQKDLHNLRQVLLNSDESALVHFHTEDVHLPVFGQNRELAARTLTTIHNPVKDWYHEYQAMPLVAISEAQRKLLGIDGFNFVRVVHNGIDADLYQPNYEIAPDSPLVFLGRFSPDKNPKGAALIAQGAGVPVRLAGTQDAQYPDAYDEIVRMSNAVGGKNIELTGMVTDQFDTALGQSPKNKFLADARALLFPIQWQEPFGLVVIEANACGTPVIAFNHPGSAVDELITDGVNGFKVNTVEEAIEAVGRLDRIDRRQVRQHFEANFTSEIMARHYADIITKELPLYRKSLRCPSGLS